MLRNLWRRPLRSSLTAAGIAVAVAGFIALTGLSRSLESAWINNLRERETHILAVQKGAVEVLTASISEKFSEDLKTVEGVLDVSGELVDLSSVDQGHAVLVTGWPEEGYLWRTLRLSEGELSAEGRQEQGAFLGQALADSLGKLPGDDITVRGRKFSVAGIFSDGSIMGNSAVVLPLSLMQELTGRSGRVTDFNIRLAHPEDQGRVSAVLSRLAAEFPDLTFTETSRVADDNGILRMLRAAAWGTSAVALIIALVVVLNTLLMSVSERTRELGILSAVGWSGRRILSMIILEGLLLSLTGSAAGSVLGIGGLKWLASLPQMHGFLEPGVTLVVVAEVSGVSVMLGVLGSVYPALRAIRLDAVDALRHE